MSNFWKKVIFGATNFTKASEEMGVLGFFLILQKLGKYFYKKNIPTKSEGLVNRGITFKGESMTYLCAY